MADHNNPGTVNPSDEAFGKGVPSNVDPSLQAPGLGVTINQPGPGPIFKQASGGGRMPSPRDLPLDVKTIGLPRSPG